MHRALASRLAACRRHDERLHCPCIAAVAAAVAAVTVTGVAAVVAAASDAGLQAPCRHSRHWAIVPAASATAASGAVLSSSTGCRGRWRPAKIAAVAARRLELAADMMEAGCIRRKAQA